MFVAGAGLGGLCVTGHRGRVFQNGLIRYRVAFPRGVAGRVRWLVNAHRSPPATRSRAATAQVVQRPTAVVELRQGGSQPLLPVRISHGRAD